MHESAALSNLNQPQTDELECAASHQKTQSFLGHADAPALADAGDVDYGVLDVVVSFWHEGQLAHMSFCTTSRSQNGMTKIAVYEGWLLCSNWLQPIRSARQMPETLWAERACTTALSTHAWGNPFVSIPPATEAAYRGPAVEELCRCWMPSS